MRFGVTSARRVDLRKLDALEKRVRVACRRAILRASRPVKAEVVRQAESIKRFGHLAKSIKTRARVYDRDNHLLIVGPSMRYSRGLSRKKADKGKKVVPFRYATILTSPKSGKRFRPWLRDAYRATSREYLQDVRRELAIEIGKILKS